MRFIFRNNKKVKNISRKIMNAFISTILTISFMSSCIVTISIAISNMGDARDYYNDQEDLLCNEDYILGGSYKSLCDTKRDFNFDNWDKRYDYDIYPLISREVLRSFGNYLKLTNEYNQNEIDCLFCFDQTWVPSIIMTTDDTFKFYSMPQSYIDNQVNELISYGNFEHLLESELNNIDEKFQGKYHQAVEQAREYIQDLKFTSNSGFIKFECLCNNMIHVFCYRPIYFN